MVEVEQLRTEVKRDIADAAYSLKEAIAEFKIEVRNGFMEISRQYEAVRQLEKREAAHHERLNSLKDRVDKIETDVLIILKDQARATAALAERVSHGEISRGVDSDGNNLNGFSNNNRRRDLTIGLSSGGLGVLALKIWELLVK